MLDTQTVDLIKESCLLHLEYTKSNSSACLERGCFYLHVGPHDCTTCCCCLCTLRLQHSAWREAGEAAAGRGGALVLWYRGGSSFGIGQRLQLQWFYCHTNWVSILVTHVCCLVSPSPYSALPCLLCLLVAATLFWLCLLFAFVCVCCRIRVRIWMPKKHIDLGLIH